PSRPAPISSGRQPFSSQVNAAIEQRARALGFDLCRCTTADPPQSAAQFQHWLDQERHGEMAYLRGNAHKRIDPRKVLPGAKSVIVLAAAYSGDKPALSHPNASSSPPSSRLNADQSPPNAGIVARYARFTDYHRVLAEKLRPLTDFVNQLGGVGTRSLWYVD